MKRPALHRQGASFPWLALLAAAALAPLLIAAAPSAPTPAPAASPPRMYTNPVGINIGDPDVLHIPGHYYIYGTGFGGFTSTDLVNWTSIGNVYQRDPATSWNTGGAFWAPEVYKFKGKDGYYFFYSATWKNNPTNEGENFRIGVAFADKPEGPFKDIRTEPIFDPGYPIIDADVLPDDDGRFYLYYSRCCYKHPVASEIADWAKTKYGYQTVEESWVYGVELKPDFSGVIGEPVLLVRPPISFAEADDAWESYSVLTGEVNRRWTEGPTSFKHNGIYYLMYSSNAVTGPNYALGYATASSPLGPFKKAANNPIVKKNTGLGGNVTTTAHGCVTQSPDGSEWFVLYGGVIRNSDPGGPARGVPATAPAPASAAPAASGPATAAAPDRGGRGGRGGFGGGFGGGPRTLFVDRLEFLPDGTLIAHSPTVTPQPYPSTQKAPP